ncbi:hypothetical protein HNQ71_006440 [Mesorhizobium sangaii]|uniref:Uncharacterized protein n=1 Tax=Mesorhizobium sangaii TaxID=505389 RepID=A0A841PID3_9HYPH|nr:hypothetical protein [Mesorhizobium sangaii]
MTVALELGMIGYRPARMTDHDATGLKQLPERSLRSDARALSSYSH